MVLGVRHNSLVNTGKKSQNKHFSIWRQMAPSLGKHSAFFPDMFK